MLKSSALYEIYGVKVKQSIQPHVTSKLNEETGSSEVDFLRKQVEQLQAELSKERQHSRDLAERLATLTDQAQQLQLAQMQQDQISESVQKSKCGWLQRLLRK